MHPIPHPLSGATVQLLTGEAFTIMDWADRCGVDVLSMEEEGLYGRVNGKYRVIPQAQIQTEET